MRSAPLAVALLGTLAVAAPMLFGQGVDAADDLVYHGTLPWEWLRTAWRTGQSPWYAPGVVGGAPLLSDAVYMAPFYPASWLVLVLPVHVAYPLVCVLHALGAALATWWLARRLGASPGSAALAGAAIGMGPLGATGIVDGRPMQWAIVVWLPVAFGCLEALKSAEGRARWRWVGGAGIAIALVLLGAHLRLAAAAGAVLVLRVLLGGLPRGPASVAVALGLLGGAPAVLPLLLEWREASAGGTAAGSLLAAMAGPAFGGIHPDNVPGLLAPTPRAMRPDYSVGLVLGAALILTAGRGRLAWRSAGGRLVALWGIVATAVFLASFPGVRYLTAPLLLITHPVNDMYLGAVLPVVAATGALALDEATARFGERPRSLGRRGLVVAVLVVGAVLVAALPSDQITDAWTRGLYLLGAGRAVAIAVAAWRMPARTWVPLGMADVALYALALHVAVPSTPLRLDRPAAQEYAELRDGYADFIDLANMEPTRYSGEGRGFVFDGEFPPYRLFVEQTQELLDGRSVPLGYAAAHGVRALAGEHKLTSVRQSVALEPLLARMPRDGPPTDADVDVILAVPEAARVIALHGIGMAVGPRRGVRVPGPIAPPCYSPDRFVVEPDPAARMRALLAAPFDPRRAWLEAPLPADVSTAAEVTCPSSRAVAANAADGPALIVFGERWHPGWRVLDEDGTERRPMPVNQIHLGVVVEPGQHRLTLDFVQPGLAAAGACALGAWFLLLGLVAPSLRETAAAAPPPPEARGWPTAAAVALSAAVALPLAVGRGVDLPDDALFHVVPLFEWLRTALLEGRSPWFVPGKLGGTSLFADASIHPLYPGVWGVLALDAHHALVASMVLHAVGTVFAVRWMARSFGASATSATLAGAGVAAGTIGCLSAIDVMVDTWPVFLWFPVALGALERLRLAPADDAAAARRWTAVAGAAVALMLLGSHLRYGAAAGAALGVWALWRPGRRAWALGALAIGLAGGAVALVPSLLEWQHAASDTARAAALSVPAHDQVALWNVPGLFAPKPLRLRPDWSVGLVLAAAFVVGGAGTRDRRLFAFAIALYATGIAGGVPILRYLFAPLLLVTHPVDTFWGALALLPGAAVGALALDRLLAEDRVALAARLRGPAGAVLGVVLAGGVLRVALASSWLPSEVERQGVLVAALQAAAVVAALVVVLRMPPGRRRTAAVAAIALIDLAALAVRFHTALPSVPLELADRVEDADAEALAGGYLHLGELADLEGFLYDTGGMGPSADLADEGENFDDLARYLRENIVHLRWPVHLGVGRGIRGASGRAKMPPRRPLALLAPLADAIVGDGPERKRLEDDHPELIRPLFRDASALGTNTLRLMRVRTAVGGIDGSLRFDAGPPQPRCWTAPSVRVLAGEDERVAELLAAPFDPAAPAIVEDPTLAERPLVPATARCDDTGDVAVEATGPALVVVGETWHPGWRVGDGRPTFPVNQVHFGFFADASDEAPLALRFVPPGLLPAAGASALAWLTVVGLALAARRSGRGA